MTLPRSSARFRLIGLAAALLALALLVGACGSAAPPTAAPPTAAAEGTAAETEAPPAATSAVTGEAPVGVDAEGNFYRGDPNAAVKLVEFSDFQ